jgi:PEP-CTERM motif
MSTTTYRFASNHRVLLGATTLLGVLGSTASAVTIDPSSSTASWTPIAYASTLPDSSNDQATGIPEADLVGDTSNPAFYYRFDDAGTPSTTDGAIAFRARIGTDSPPSGFDRFLAVGIDANSDGAIDLFLTVDNSGSPDRVAIFDAGSGANTSPSTSSIANTALFSYALSATNFHFGAVNATIDPTATSFDLDADTKNDYFVSFVIPFTDVVSAMIAQGIGGFDDATAMRFVIGTSTQPNALNQDLGGPNGNTASAQTWSQLGAISNMLTSSGGFAAVPEPGTGLLVSFGLLAIAMRERRA